MTSNEPDLSSGFTTQTGEQRRAKLRQSIRKGRLVVAPGVFEMISARIADRMGFEALYMTGYGTVASYLGMPDAGIASYTDMQNRVSQFTRITSTPMICDGDTGYGGLLNVMHTVRGYEAAGASAIQLEDQEFPKKCGHVPGRRVVPAADMAAKIRVAVETRNDPNFLIIARTDARTTLGVDEAMRRAELYARAGADLLFIESPESIEEMEKIGAAFDLPLVANMVEGGRTPILSADELARLGFGLAIFPATAFLGAAAAMESVYGTLKQQRSSAGIQQPLYDFDAFSKAIGFDWVQEFDREHAEKEQS
ncbi:isocitrate lyase/PEP mutase family protein [Caenimonas soli]|uniref:isocitrate lyase/PEP mutase family protein n=1 Tax=Caenimonas soli TaxID=2735555 RepID=UPI001553A423|nr:isocitrate lyase/PEP mutase family protein [Caenimonas soli]NPC56943.1 isocitrate lyase/PEP mutase family protein [Caenimonas soli]